MYESVIVMHPRLSDDEVAGFADKIKQLVLKGGGEILGEDKWGRRKLAYPIGDSREGFYLYSKFNAAGSLVTKINQFCRMQEDVLRALVVHVEEIKSIPPRKPKPRVAVAAVAAPAIEALVETDELPEDEE